MNPDCQCSLSPDPWLQQLFGYPVYRLALPAEDLPLPTEFARTVEDRLAGSSAQPVFAYTKVNVAEVRQAQSLEQLGFRLVDTNVVLEKPRDPFSLPESPVRIRFARPEDEEGLISLAGRAFSRTRFHLDPHIPPQLANTIKAEWARSYFRGKRGDHMVVAEAEGHVVGFNQLLSAGGVLTIDLTGVEFHHRRRGIAAGMCRFAEQQLSSLPTLRVGTQVGNTDALRFYENYGFRVVQASYVFHYHRSALVSLRSPHAA